MPSETSHIRRCSQFEKEGALTTYARYTECSFHEAHEGIILFNYVFDHWISNINNPYSFATCELAKLYALIVMWEYVVFCSGCIQ